MIGGEFWECSLNQFETRAKNDQRDFCEEFLIYTKSQVCLSFRSRQVTDCVRLILENINSKNAQ